MNGLCQIFNFVWLTILLGCTLLYSFTYTLCRFFGYAIFMKYRSLSKKNVAFQSVVVSVITLPYSYAILVRSFIDLYFF